MVRKKQNTCFFLNRPTTSKLCAIIHNRMKIKFLSDFFMSKKVEAAKTVKKHDTDKAYIYRTGIVIDKNMYILVYWYISCYFTPKI